MKKIVVLSLIASLAIACSNAADSAATPPATLRLMLDVGNPGLNGMMGRGTAFAQLDGGYSRLVGSHVEIVGSAEEIPFVRDPVGIVVAHFSADENPGGEIAIRVQTPNGDSLPVTTRECSVIASNFLVNTIAPNGAISLGTAPASLGPDAAGTACRFRRR